MLDRILITNDDGIEAPGLAILERIAGELAHEVWIVAPEHDQSGVSHAVSLHHPIRVSERGLRRYGITGTPGDCAVMGACHLMPEAPQLLLSGVNRGANLGLETVFSGTVGGAMTGMLLGIPSIALSQAWTDRANVRWKTAAALGADVVRRLLAIGWSAATCLNVNFPDVPAQDAGPLTLARQGPGLIQGMRVETRTDPRGLDLSLDQLPPRAARSRSGERCRGVGGWQYRRDAAALRPDRRGSLRDAREGLAAVIHPRGQSWRIGSLPSQSIAAARTASKMRRRVGVSSAISMTVPGWPSFRK